MKHPTGFSKYFISKKAYGNNDYKHSRTGFPYVKSALYIARF